MDTTKVWLVKESGDRELEVEITLYHRRETAFAAFRRLVVENFCDNGEDIAAARTCVAEADALSYEGGMVSNGEIHIELEEKEVL